MMLIIGHRGAAGLAPENTLLSFARALDYEADELEFDVRLTKDNFLVVVHDTTVDRTTNGRGRVAELCLADLVRLDAGQKQPLPSLYDVLCFLRCQTPFLNIEIKDSGCGERVAMLIKQFADEHRTCVISFDIKILRKVKKLGLNVGLDFEERARDNLAAARRLKAWRVLPHKRLVTPWLVQRAHKLGMQVVPWTVNDPDEMRRLAGMGVDGLCTDYPNRAYEIFKKPAAV